MQKRPSISSAKAILATLWREKELTREKIKKHRYTVQLCASKSDVTFRGSLMRLLDSQMINVSSYGLYTLNDKARNKAAMSFIDVESRLNTSKANRWDGGWRIIMFNIPEGERFHRDRLRYAIRVAGFKQVQSGIWAYPYPVPPFLKTIFSEEPIKSHIRFITSKRVERDSDLKKIFNLK